MGTFSGRKHTPEARRKMRESWRWRTGHAVRPEARARISEALRGRRCGDENPNWRGGRATNGQGYILIRKPEHPHAYIGPGYVLEHRVIMEEHLGRYLEPGEVVHHINGQRDDNRIENLRLVTTQNHKGELTCPCCGYVLYVR